LEIFSRLIGTACSEVHAEHRFRLGQLAPLNELVCSKSVCLRAEPSEIEPFRPFVERTYAILPVIARHEIASGVTDDRRTKFSNQLEDVMPKSVLVCCWVAGLKYAGVNATTQVLNE